MCVRARSQGVQGTMKNTRSTAARLATGMLTLALFAGAAPAMATVIQDAPTGDIATVKFASQLASFEDAVKVEQALVTVAPKAEAPVANTLVATNEKVESAAQMTAAPTLTQAPVAAAAPKTQSTAPVAAPTKRSGQTSGGELAQAKAILASLIAQHPVLKGTTVEIGDTPGDYQAVAYYKSGRIVISTSHTASLERILNHEVWHVIDWRDNGQIDWGENIPPR